MSTHHYHEAERLMAKALNGDEPFTPDLRIRVLAAAQVHATLALVERVAGLTDVVVHLVPLSPHRDEGASRKGGAL